MSLTEERWGMIELPNNELSMTDLFCGAGVGASGFKLAGFDIRYAIDNQKYAVNTYNQNIGNHAIVGDIRKLKSNEVPDTDVIAGGFPCTSFSVAGKGEGVNDKEKGDLGYHFYRVIKEKQPKAFLMENVAGLLTKKHKGFFDELMQLFDDAGYSVSWKLINTWEYGVPQLRKRVFAIGIRKDLDKIFVFPEPIPEEKRRTIRDAIGDLPDPDGLNNHKGYGIRKDELPFVDKVPPGGNWRDIPEEDQEKFLGKAFYSGGGRTGFLRKVKFDNPAWTLTSCMNGKNNAQIVDNRDKYRIDDVKNQEDYYKGDYSPRYKSRNRQKQWDEPSFTIVSSARQLPLYPEPANYDIREMDMYEVAPPRRFTVRECLRLQTVPDWFSFSNEVSLSHQYERCSGIPSLIAYEFGVELAKLLKEPKVK